VQSSSVFSIFTDCISQSIFKTNSMKQILYKKIFFLFFFILSTNAIFANLRAPWVVNRYPSYSLASSNPTLVVLKENLEFNCDPIYEGEGNLSRIVEKNCKVEAVYFIQSAADVSYPLEFILPSGKNVITTVNDLEPQTTKPTEITISDLEKEGYRLSDLCKFCEERINKLYTATFTAKFALGSNKIRVQYEQPLAITEVSHGYFQSSKWSNAFSYELWPLRDWKLDPKFEMKIKFTTKVGGAFSRLFGNKVKAECRGLDLRFVKTPSPTFKKQSGENGFKNFYEYNQNLNPYYIFTTESKTYYESENLIYELSLKDKFPDRLACYYGHDKN
jgi:hypothetical protein